MDNKRSPKETRTRRDTMSVNERQLLGKGYPVRPDADTQNYRPVNHRPRADGGQIPEYMRRGEIPIRKNAAQKQTPPQATDGIANDKIAHTATMTISREALHPQDKPAQTNSSAAHATTDPLEQTRTISRDALRHRTTPPADDNMTKTVHFDRGALHMAQAAGSGKSAAHSAEDTVQPRPSRKKAADASIAPAQKHTARHVPWIPVLGATVVVLALAITLPIALHKNQAPSDADYDMAQGFAPDALTVTEKTTDNHNTKGTESDTDTPHGEPTTADTGTPETEAETAAAKFSVTLTFFDRDPITVSTGKTTLGALLDKVGYTVRDTDKFPLDLTAELTADATIAVDTVTYDTITTTEVIPYTSNVTEVQTIPRGTKEIAQYGQNGEKTITYTVTYCNGEEISREQSGESITKYPVEEISTLGIGGTLVGSDGNTYSYSYYKVCNATYYDIEGITYLGYNADESVVATDKSCIPMGTKLYVKNDTFDFGVRTAADTGSMIQGWEVDIWLSDSNPQKAAFAKGGYWNDMRVYFLD